MYQGASKFIFGLLIGVGIALLTIGGILLTWVATGPRALDKLTPYIEKAFTAKDGSYSVKIGQTWLLWNSWHHPIDIRLRDVSIITQQGQTFSAFPEISLGLDILSLPLGRILPTSLIINTPVISLYQNEDNSISFGFRRESGAPVLAEAAEVGEPVEAPTETIPLKGVFAVLLNPERGSDLRKLSSVTILDADVSVGNRKRGVFCEAKKVDMQAVREKGILRFISTATVRYEEYQSTIRAYLTFDRNKPVIDGQLEFKGLVPGVLIGLFDSTSPLKAVTLPLSGTSNFSFDHGAVLQRMRFKVQGGGGTIESPYLDGPLTVSALSTEGKIANDFRDIQIDSLIANLNTTTLSGRGLVSLNGDNTAVLADINIKNVPGNDVHLFWPPDLSPESRLWVTENITEGVVPEAKAHVDIKAGDIAKPILPKESVDASFIVQGATVRYLPEHPKLHNVSGVIHVDGIALNADIATASFLKETSLAKGTLEIPDLNADNPRIKVTLDATTTGKDAYTFLKLPRVNHAGHLSLTENMEGTANLTAALEFDFYAPHDQQGNPVGEADIDFDVTAHLKEISQQGFMQKFDIEKADGTLTINNAVLNFKGSGRVNGADVSNAQIHYLFHPEEGFDTFINVRATAPVESLPRFGYPAFSFLKGQLGVIADVKQGVNDEISAATIDLSEAEVDYKDIGWSKAAKEPATLELKAEKHNGNVTIPSFRLESKGTKVTGSGTLNKELTAIESLTLQKPIIIGETKLDSLVFAPIEGGFRLEAQGASADVTGWAEGDSEPGKGRHFSFEHFPAVQFKGDIGRVIFGKGRELEGFIGELTCDTRICSKANLTGKSGGKPFTFRIMRNPTGKRQLFLHAENAGAFLKSLNVFDGMEEGDLSITGNYEESGKSSVLKGRVDVIDYTVKEAPILAQILSLASLTGFFDTLQGNGIRFSKLTAPFTLNNDVITFEKGKTHGPAIGMTMDGTITMPEVRLDLEGTVVPAYTLNNILGKVPLFGMMLTGGEGQGIIAARYSVKGTEKDPKVSVNPLSMLTPGFLRGLFDILDAPKTKEQEKEPEPVKGE